MKTLLLGFIYIGMKKVKKSLFLFVVISSSSSFCHDTDTTEVVTNGIKNILWKDPLNSFIRESLKWVF